METIQVMREPIEPHWEWTDPIPWASDNAMPVSSLRKVGGTFVMKFGCEPDTLMISRKAFDFYIHTKEASNSVSVPMFPMMFWQPPGSIFHDAFESRPDSPQEVGQLSISRFLIFPYRRVIVDDDPFHLDKLFSTARRTRDICVRVNIGGAFVWIIKTID